MHLNECYLPSLSSKLQSLKQTYKKTFGGLYGRAKTKSINSCYSLEKISQLAANRGAVVIVESEFDALLTQQEAGDLCSTVALGGVAKKPDVVTHNLLKKCSLILYALDFDDAGKKAYLFWRQKYANLRPWPVAQAKSPGDAIKNGISLREWVLQGISEYSLAFKKTNLNEK